MDREYSAEHNAQEARWAVEALQERIETLEADNGKLRERLAALEKNGTIDRAAALQNWERIDTLERRADGVDALNHSRAEIINDACDRIEKLEARITNAETDIVNNDTALQDQLDNLAGRLR